jgi:hypothetical protein
MEEFEKQRQAGTEGRIQDVVEVAIRAAAAATGAIEGLYPITTGQTIHVAERFGDWQSELGAVGGNSLALFEAQLRAYHMADSVAASDIGFTASGIRQLHVELCTPQLASEPELRIGEFKLEDNCTKKSDGTIHRYARWGDAAPELNRLIDAMRLPEFADAHPALQAAYAHLAFAAIHPFEDGNGRVARALSSALLQRTIGIPLIIYADQKDRYLAALERADQNDYAPFIRFIFDRCLHSMRFVADRVAATVTPESEDFERLYAAQAGLSFQEITAIAQRVGQEMAQVFTELLPTRRLPSQVSGGVSQQNRGPLTGKVFAEQFRETSPPNQTLTIVLGLASQPPATAQVQTSFAVLVARDISDRFPFVIANWDAPADRFDIRLDEVHPENTTDYVIGRRAWAERQISEALTRLYDSAKANRQN